MRTVAVVITVFFFLGFCVAVSFRRGLVVQVFVNGLKHVAETTVYFAYVCSMYVCYTLSLLGLRSSTEIQLNKEDSRKTLRKIESKAVSFINSVRRSGSKRRDLRQFTWFTCRGNQIRVPVRKQGMLPPVEWRHRVHNMYSRNDNRINESNESVDHKSDSDEPDSPSPGCGKVSAVNCTIACGVSIRDDSKPYGGGEDAFFVSVNGQAMGVADGVGGVTAPGAASGAFARHLMSSCGNSFDRWIQPSVSTISDDQGAITPRTPLETNGGKEYRERNIDDSPASTPSKLEAAGRKRAILPSDVAAALICSAYKNVLQHGPDGASTIIVVFLQPSPPRPLSIPEPGSPPLSFPKEGENINSAQGTPNSLESTKCDKERVNILAEKERVSPRYRYRRLRHTAGSTSSLGIANIGDSGCMVLRRDTRSGERKTVFKSEEQQHEFNCPHQLGKLSQQQCDPPSASARYNVAVSRGDLIILATDGLFDNLWEWEVAAVCDWFVSPQDSEELHQTYPHIAKDCKIRSTPPGVVASLVASAAHARSHDIAVHTPWKQRMKTCRASGRLFEGGKPDDITVVAAWVD